jgi:Mn-dependent DtxR family transcriptional regulator
MTLSVSEELSVKMKKYPKVKWSAVAREAIVRELEKLEILDKLLSNSKLTEQDAERIGHKLKREMAKRF